MASPLATAILQGTAASTPQQPFRATVAPTDVEKANADYNNAIQQTYAAQIGQQNALWGGLAGLGSAGLLALGGGGGGGALAKLLSGGGSLSPGQVGPGVNGSTYTIGYGGQNMPVYG
jgi:hypothetical protein